MINRWNDESEIYGEIENRNCTKLAAVTHSASCDDAQAFPPALTARVLCRSVADWNGISLIHAKFAAPERYSSLMNKPQQLKIDKSWSLIITTNWINFTWFQILVIAHLQNDLPDALFRQLSESRMYGSARLDVDLTSDVLDSFYGLQMRNPQILTAEWFSPASNWIKLD